MPTLKKSKSAMKIKAVAPKPKVWTGPMDAGPLGGITQSLLSLFLVCRERFRLRVIEGLHSFDRFNHRIEYGNMWHVCEEAIAKTGGSTATDRYSFNAPLIAYCQELSKKYPLDGEQIDKWYNVCKYQFPYYVEYWSKHPDVKERTPLLQEQVFHIPYTLPSGRVVYLRGKWDSVDLIGKGKAAGIYLQENKTKGDVDEVLLRRQLTFDLQTMLYIIALDNGPTEMRAALIKNGINPNVPIMGVRYNVIRRPLSGGRGTIKRNELKETKEEYYARLAQYFIDEPEYWFLRLKVEITPGDIERFKHECLNPVLEQLCDWYEHIIWKPDPNYDYKDYLNYRLPYGIYNPIADGVPTEVDEYLASGSTAGLDRDVPLFGELQ